MFLFRTDQGAKSFCQKVGVERLLERLVDRGTIEAHRVPIIGQQCDQNRLGKVGVLPQILANLQRFDFADREIDNDTVRVETFGLNS